MKSNYLIAAIGDIDPELVLSAKNTASMQNQAVRNKAFHKHGYKVLIAAAVFVMLVASAFAYWTVGDGFLHFFTKQSGQDLSPGGKQYIEENTVGIGQKVSVDGWAVMIDTAICDANHVYLKIDIEAPAGVNLTGQNYAFRQHSLSTEQPERNGVLYVGGTWSVMREEGKGDNATSLILTQEMVAPTGSGISYTSGASHALRLEDLCVWQGETEKVLAEGVWTFVFKLSGDSKEAMEFVNQPVACEAYRLTGEKTEVQLTSFRLSPFGAICKYTFADGGTPEAIHLSVVKAILDDGREIELMPSAGLIEGEKTGICSYMADEPIPVQDIDCVVFQNGIELSEANKFVQ